VPSIKCSVCGQRILNPTGLMACPNCGAPLVPQPATSTAGQYYSTSSSEENAFAGTILGATPYAFNNGSDSTAPPPSIDPTMTGSQYPKQFPQRHPDVKGTIIHIETHEEPKSSGGAAEVAFKTISDIIWSMFGLSSTQASKEKEKEPVMRIRIREHDGMLRDVRLEGRLTGINIAQGDIVALWGKKKGSGPLVFEQGYNHTADGSITS
jgi:predicted RNA-binding Zn-ribbon protein involved in translation (DUF1610 family)